MTFEYTINIIYTQINLKSQNTSNQKAKEYILLMIHNFKQNKLDKNFIKDTTIINNLVCLIVKDISTITIFRFLNIYLKYSTNYELNIEYIETNIESLQATLSFCENNSNILIPTEII